MERSLTQRVKSGQPVDFDDSRNFKGAGKLLWVTRNDKSFTIRILFLGIGSRQKINAGTLSVRIGGKTYKGRKFRRHLNLPFFLRFVKSHIPYDSVTKGEIHNKVFVRLSRQKDWTSDRSIRFKLSARISGVHRATAVVVDKQKKLTIFFRQARDNNLILTVRPTVRSDNFRDNFKINVAYFLSHLVFWVKPILLFEKEAGKYEESASSVYEELIDQGYKNVFFVLGRDSKQWKYIKNEYQTNILKKYTFKHYIYFFLCKSFISTETPGHAVDLRSTNRRVMQKISVNDYKFVFLQHGVMYMVSLGSKQRRNFRKGRGAYPENMKIVVSSQAEADHFIKFGEYSQKDLYVTGLPKFDKSFKNKGADRITIMPTWRPWEYNSIREKPELSGYYKMIDQIIQGIPSTYHHKIHLLPHPMVIEALRRTKFDVFIKPYESYDEVLRNTDTLITDYSSVAFDSFYRGSNVIFWWKDKEYCMEQYGGWLMLDKSSAFGHIANSEHGISKIINKVYKSTQSNEHVKKFENIVSFRDGNCTKRLVEQLKRDSTI